MRSLWARVMVVCLVAPTLAGFAPLPAGDPGKGGPQPRYDGSRGELEVRIPFLAEASVRMNGRLDDAEWSRAIMLHGFTEFSPVEGIPARHPTEVLIFRTNEALYFGVRAFDPDPSGIRASLRDRDNVADSDDYIRISLDTFNDQRRAFILTVNPLGVQEDGVWVEGGVRTRGGRGPPIDKSPDLVWESEGQIEDWGYSLEIRVPIKSLRFRNAPVQKWGLNVERRVQQSGFQSTWAPLNQNEANTLAMAGTIVELEGLDPGLFLEVNPVFTGRRTGAWDVVSGSLVHDTPVGEFGLNLTYGLTSNLTLDATVNPDFSQVEADAGEVTVNERFAIRLPEKRPFFLEGTDIFQLSQPLIFTRTVASPSAGAKITGKSGPLALGYLAAMDEPEDGGRTAVNLLRLRRDLGESSALGLVYTDRTHLDGGHNRVGALDTRMVLRRRYTAQLVAAGSSTAEGPDNSSSTGHLLYAELQRTGREFSWGVLFEDIAPEFRAESGFIPRVGHTRLRGETARSWFGAPGAVVQRWGVTAQGEGYWDPDAFRRGDSRLESELQLGANVTFRSRVTLFATSFYADYLSPPEAYAGLFRRENGGLEPFTPESGSLEGLRGLRLFFFASTWERVGGTLRLQWQEVPVFDRALGVGIEPAITSTVDANLNLRPTQSLSSTLGVRAERSAFRADGERSSRAIIPRTRAQYQFTRSIYVRAVAEYSSQEREPLRDPVSGTPLLFCGAVTCTASSGFQQHRLLGQLLFAYQPTPGTVVFVGWGHTARDDRALGFSGLESQTDGLFVKGSYRLRF